MKVPIAVRAWRNVAIGASVDLLLLERLHEALRLGIVVGIADAAHARLDVVPLQQLGVVAAGILHAAIGMMDQAAGRGLRETSAIVSAAVARLACRCVSSAQPTTRRLNASSTMAR